MTRRSFALLVAAGLLALVALPVFGCAKGSSTLSTPPAAHATAPAAPDLRTPLSAVRSYLDWWIYSSLVGKSGIATATMTPDEAVRVDSYIEQNRQKGQRISERLVSFKPRPVSVGPTSTLLPADEKWQYAYVSVDGGRSLTETYTLSYESTYTLVGSDASGWRVASVNAKALGTVK
jgi:hypothetical protein